MTAIARRDLVACEEVIERGLHTFVEVAQALMEIRDHRLYRLTHDTFEHYCRERWDFSDSRGRQLISAIETVTTVTLAGLPAPTNERQIRALAPLRGDPEKTIEVWSEAVAESDGHPTAATVTEIVARHLEADPTVQLARWRQAFTRAVSQAQDLMLLDPIEVAARIDDADMRSLSELHASITTFLARIRAAQPKTFDVIQGGMS